MSLYHFWNCEELNYLQNYSVFFQHTSQKMIIFRTLICIWMERLYHKVSHFSNKKNLTFHICQINLNTDLMNLWNRVICKLLFILKSIFHKISKHNKYSFPSISFWNTRSSKWGVFYSFNMIVSINSSSTWIFHIL